MEIMRVHHSLTMILASCRRCSALRRASRVRNVSASPVLTASANNGEQSAGRSVVEKAKAVGTVNEKSALKPEGAGAGDWLVVAGGGAGDKLHVAALVGVNMEAWSERR